MGGPHNVAGDGRGGDPLGRQQREGEAESRQNAPYWDLSRHVAKKGRMGPPPKVNETVAYTYVAIKLDQMSPHCERGRNGSKR